RCHAGPISERDLLPYPRLSADICVRLRSALLGGPSCLGVLAVIFSSTIGIAGVIVGGPGVRCRAVWVVAGGGPPLRRPRRTPASGPGPSCRRGGRPRESP